MSDGDAIKKTVSTVLSFLCQDDDEGFIRDVDRREGSTLADQIWGAKVGPEAKPCRFCQCVHAESVACAVHAQTAQAANPRCLYCLRPHASSAPCSSVADAPLVASSSAGGVRSTAAPACVYCGGKKTVVMTDAAGVAHVETCPKC